jgi:hypothetical protein
VTRREDVGVDAPAAGTIVMATGIESVVLRTAGQRVLSEVLLWLAVAAWTTLAPRFGGLRPPRRLAGRPRRGADRRPG